MDLIAVFVTDRCHAHSLVDPRSDPDLYYATIDLCMHACVLDIVAMSFLPLICAYVRVHNRCDLV